MQGNLIDPKKQFDYSFRSYENRPKLTFEEFKQKQEEKYREFSNLYYNNKYIEIGIDPGYKLYIAAAMRENKTRVFTKDIVDGILQHDSTKRT